MRGAGSIPLFCLFESDPKLFLLFPSFLVFAIGQRELIERSWQVQGGAVSAFGFRPSVDPFDGQRRVTVSRQFSCM